MSNTLSAHRAQRSLFSSCVLLIALGCGLCTAQTATATVVTVGDMNATDWSLQRISTSGSPTLVSSTPNPGGNPGSYWQFNQSSPTVIPAGQTNQVREAFLFNNAVYNPTIQGALGSVGIGFDTRNFSSNVGGGFGGFATAILAQGGRYYSAINNGSRSISGLDWIGFDFVSTLASDWFELGTNSSPDFSATGDAMTFGFRMSLGGACPITAANGCTGPITVSGLDNFRYELTAAPRVSAVPEPATLMLLGLGLAGLGAMRRRR